MFIMDGETSAKRTIEIGFNVDQASKNAVIGAVSEINNAFAVVGGGGLTLKGSDGSSAKLDVKQGQFTVQATGETFNSYSEYKEKPMEHTLAMVSNRAVRLFRDYLEGINHAAHHVSIEGAAKVENGFNVVVSYCEVNGGGKRTYKSLAIDDRGDFAGVAPYFVGR